MDRPTRVNVLGIEYSIEYKDKPSEVDIFKRESCWGQLDHWGRSIRVFDAGNRSAVDLLGVIVHELLHAMEEELHLGVFDPKDDKEHKALDLLAKALIDSFVRSGWIDLPQYWEPSKEDADAVA